MRFPKRRRPELFITLEGCEGSGKSTQARLLERWFAERQLPAVFVRDPGTTDLGDRLRASLVGPAREELAIGPWAEALLYTAARAQLVEEIVVPSLKRGMWVISDRYIDSTLAYQGHGLGLALDVLREVNEAATGRLWPGRTFLFDVSADVGLERTAGRRDACGPDRIEARELSFHERVHRGYRQLAAAEPGRWRVVPGELDISSAHEFVIREIKNLLGEV